MGSRSRAGSRACLSFAGTAPRISNCNFIRECDLRFAILIFNEFTSSQVDIFSARLNLCFVILFNKKFLHVRMLFLIYLPKYDRNDEILLILLLISSRRSTVAINWCIRCDSFDLEEQLQEAVVVSLCPRVSMRSVVVTPDWPRSTRGAFAADSKFE